MFPSRLALLLLLPFVSAAEPPVKPTVPVVPKGFHIVALNGHNFTLPDGFTIELVASSPQVNRPISASFDDKGRLYVTDSSGSNDKTSEQVKTKPHRIVRFEDTDGEGKFDKSTVFVKNVMFPEGAMWYRGSLYVAAPPHIWKFTDTDGDGIADKEEIWFDGKTLTGCANDLHGPWLGPDGWIYWTKGAFAKQEYTLANGKKWSTRASHIFRAKPDGTNIEPVMTGGMDNPVGLAFTPAGEPILCGTFYQHPADGKRDGILHAVYGGVWGKDHDPIYEHPWTSPQLMPMMTHLGPAAPAGMIRYQSDQFGKEYQDNLFCSQFNMRKVSRHVLVPEGSTYRTIDSDFVVSDNFDFHPTDVVEDADGSLLILDTGGWYKLCCPTSQLVKAEVLGAIYRVKKTGAHKIEDARGLKIEWDKLKPAELAKLFDDPRPVVRWKAVEKLATFGKDAKQAVVNSFTTKEGKLSDRGLLFAVHCSSRIKDSETRNVLLCSYLHLGNTPDVSSAATLAIGMWKDKDLFGGLPMILDDGKFRQPSERRFAAATLGRLGDSSAIPLIFDAIMFEKNDRFLEHALTYALIEIADPKATAIGLTQKYPHVRRIAMTALDQMSNGKLEAKFVLAELDSKEPDLKETAWWIAGHHPEWGELLAGYFRERLAKIEKMTPPEQDTLTARLVPFFKSAEIRKVAGDALHGTIDPSSQRSLLRALARSGLKAFPDEWNEGVQQALISRTENVMRDAIAVLRAVPPSAADHAAISAKVLQHHRLLQPPLGKEFEYSLRATAPIGTSLEREEAAGVIADIHKDKLGAVRAAAAELLGRASLPVDSLIALANALKTANPVELAKLIAVFAKPTDAKVGFALIRTLSDPTVRRSVRLEQVKPIFDKYPAEVKAKAETLYALLAEDRKDERAKLEKLAASLPVGDAKRGQAVFNGAKAACATCHKLGYVGGTLGPDLTRIGGIRSERDLLEAIVLPSASFVRSYEPYRVVTVDGKVLNGILKKDAPDEVVLAPAADQLVRIPRGDIDEMTPSTVSVMPAGLDQQLSPQDLADLVTFLKANTR